MAEEYIGSQINSSFQTAEQIKDYIQELGKKNLLNTTIKRRMKKPHDLRGIT